MANSETEVAIIGGGAAGIAAGRRLREAGIDCLVIEARPRLGGRAWTVTDQSGFALDLGCGWLHSADRNPWTKIAEAQGRTIDKTPPPWTKPALPIRFPLDEQQDFRKSMDELYDRVEAILAKGGDVPAADALKPDGRWNNLLTAVGTYISGVELSRISGARLHQLSRLGSELEHHRGLMARPSRPRGRNCARRSNPRSAGSTTAD